MRPPPPQGKVLFNRNLDSPEVEKKAEGSRRARLAVEVTDAERASLTFTAYDLDVHLTPAESLLAVHVGIYREELGEGAAEEACVSDLFVAYWESFAMQSEGRVVPLTFTQHAIDTDADHTGKATEAVVTLPQPLDAGCKS